MPDWDMWDKRFMELAVTVASWSKDPSTKVGAVYVDKSKRVVVTGYNGYPADLDDCCMEDRDYKYPRIIHAEMNGLLTALKHGVSVQGTRLYTTRFPCERCAPMLIQAGVETIRYLPNADYESRWAKNVALANDMFKEAAVWIQPVFVPQPAQPNTSKVTVHRYLPNDASLAAVERYQKECPGVYGIAEALDGVVKELANHGLVLVNLQDLINALPENGNP